MFWFLRIFVFLHRLNSFCFLFNVHVLLVLFNDLREVTFWKIKLVNVHKLEIVYFWKMQRFPLFWVILVLKIFNAECPLTESVFFHYCLPPLICFFKRVFFLKINFFALPWPFNVLERLSQVWNWRRFDCDFAFQNALMGLVLVLSIFIFLLVVILGHKDLIHRVLFLLLITNNSCESYVLLA